MSAQKQLRRKFAANGCDSETFGTPELCTWPVGPGISRFQTTSPAIASKLAERRVPFSLGRFAFNLA